jgi:hypothetical protein
MRRRLYFVLPDLKAAERTLDDLLLARIEIGHIHCLVKRGLPLGTLPEASYLQKSDLVHGAQIGMIVGGLGGIVVGTLLVFMPVAGNPLPLAAILITAVGGALFGAWASSLIAASTPNSRLLAFKNDIDDGRILMMVDVPASRVDEIRTLVGQRHPEALPKGMEPMIPAFP